MTDAPEMPADAANFAPQHLVTSGAGLEKRVAETRLNYERFRAQFDYRSAAEAYRNMLFDTLLRRLTILSGSEFGCAGEILFDGGGLYLKISDSGFRNRYSSPGGSRFWEQNFGTRAEVRHLDNPLKLDLKTPRTIIANDPGTNGRYLGLPALSDDRFVGYIIVAGAPEDYTPGVIASITPVVSVYAGVIEYLRADAARAAREKDASPVEEAPAFVFNCNIDADRSINYIGGEADVIAGLRARDLTGDGACNYASLIDAGDRERVAAVIARHLKERSKYEVEYRILRADGTKRRVYEQGSAIYDENSNPVSIDGCVLDITNTAQDENGSEQYRRRFQALIEQQTGNFVAQRERVLQAVKAKSEFISNISHELRTPMHAILSYSKMGIADCDGENHEAIKEYFGKIQTAGSRLLSLINNLLDISKMEAGKMAFKKSWCDFSEVIEHTLSELDSLIKNKSLTLTAEVTAKNTSTICDKQRMIQVMVNLISNAVKFSSRGDDIRVCVADGHLPDGTDALCCSVADNGAGIPEAELEEVFGKFIQSSKTKTGAGGTGLGLAICLEIVAAHSGRIWAENRKPRGAVFSFMIPRNAGQ